jgi:hypothetical protein
MKFLKSGSIVSNGSFKTLFVAILSGPWAYEKKCGAKDMHFVLMPGA